MNARTVNISSLVILLALLSLICEGFLYYFLPSPIWSIVFAVFVSLALSHFFLESSFSYSYNVLHAAFMTIGAFIYAVIVYCIQPNPWLHYSFYLVLLVLVNWLTPFLYCSIRDLYDTTPHFEGYRRFFIQMSIVLLVCYILALIKQYYITPIVPPYKEPAFGAQNFVPFMATGNYLESALRNGSDLFPLICYLAEAVCLYIPFGYYICAYFLKWNYIFRLFLYLAFPAAMEISQAVSGLGRGQIDDYTLALLGILIGTLLFHAMNGIFRSFAGRSILSPRNQINLNHFIDSNFPQQ